MDVITCKKCHTSFSVSQQFCPNCGMDNGIESSEVQSGVLPESKAGNSEKGAHQVISSTQETWKPGVAGALQITGAFIAALPLGGLVMALADEAVHNGDSISEALLFPAIIGIILGFVGGFLAMTRKNHFWA